MFGDYLLAIDFPDGDERVTRKMALLRASIGVEGYRVNASLVANVKESYEDAVVHLEFHIERKLSQIFQRTLFTSCVQAAGETVSQYIASLCELAAEYGLETAQLDEGERDQFVAWSLEPKIREKLLQTPDKSTLEQLVQVAKTWERSMKEAPVLSEQSANCMGAISSHDRRLSRRTDASSVKCYACVFTVHHLNVSLRTEIVRSVVREDTLLIVAQVFFIAALHETEAEGKHTALELGQGT